MTTPTNEGSCLNCESLLQGNWCYACGQKRIAEEERRLSWLVRDFTSKVTNLEGKLLRSLLALVFQPGRLGAEWLAGKRIRWTAPMALFLLVNVIYFIAPPTTDFSLPLRDQLDGQAHSRWAVPLVERRIPGVSEWIESNESLPRPKGYTALATKFDDRTQNHSKLLLIAQVPLMAFALWLLHWRRPICFVDHFAVALHFWAFILLLLIFVRGASSVTEGWFSTEQVAWSFWGWTINALLISYVVLMLRRAYGQPLPMAVVKAVPVLGVCVVSHLCYRGLLFAATYLSL